MKLWTLLIAAAALPLLLACHGVERAEQEYEETSTYSGLPTEESARGLESGTAAPGTATVAPDTSQTTATMDDSGRARWVAPEMKGGTTTSTAPSPDAPQQR